MNFVISSGVIYWVYSKKQDSHVSIYIRRDLTKWYFSLGVPINRRSFWFKCLFGSEIYFKSLYLSVILHFHNFSQFSLRCIGWIEKYYLFLQWQALVKLMNLVVLKRRKFLDHLRDNQIFIKESVCVVVFSRLLLLLQLLQIQLNWRGDWQRHLKM